MSLSKPQIVKSISRREIVEFAKNTHNCTPLRDGFEAICVQKICAELDISLEDIDGEKVAQFARNARTRYRTGYYLSEIITNAIHKAGEVLFSLKSYTIN